MNRRPGKVPASGNHPAISGLHFLFWFLRKAIAGQCKKKEEEKEFNFH